MNDNLVSVSINETTTILDLADIIEVFAWLKDNSLHLGSYLSSERFDDIVFRGIPASLSR